MIMNQKITKEGKLAKLAVVLPRYGKSLGGGAETLARALIEKLHDSSFPESYIPEIEVWTTCAIDHRTWENFHPAGVTNDNGIVVRRFPVDARDLEVFIHNELAIQDGRPVGIDSQLDWLENSVNSQTLYQHIEQHGAEFQAILFAPYLFATTFWGALIHPERSVLIPCLHDENYAYQDVFKHLFGKVRGLIFNAPAEMELARRLYNLPGFDEKSAVVGMGFERLGELSKGEPRPYLLYSGRKEQGKNLDLLIKYFSDYKVRFPGSPLELKIIGAGDIHFMETLPVGVSDLGFVSEEEKEALMQGALALCQPSVNESFSIVIMEAWLRGTPVIVHANCAVTREHVVSSGGGLYFANSEDFSGALQLIINDSVLRGEMGEAGRRFVESVYSWEAVLERVTMAFRQFGLVTDSGALQELGGIGNDG